MTDFSHVPTRHDAVNQRLEDWSRWVRVKPSAWKTHPMWANYRAPKQYEDDGIRVELNTLECFAMEMEVSALPEKFRTAVRWYYVFSKVPVIKVRQQLGVTSDGLRDLVESGRDMLKNRLRMS